jgi:hypothetical protein
MRDRLQDRSETETDFIISRLAIAAAQAEVQAFAV